MAAPPQSSSATATTSAVVRQCRKMGGSLYSEKGIPGWRRRVLLEIIEEAILVSEAPLGDDISEHDADEASSGRTDPKCKV